MPSFFPEDQDDLEQQNLITEQEGVESDGRTPLDKTIDRIGMGSYQWTLLSLCGFGWMADNMWIQAVAIILPRIQIHYDVPDGYIGGLSSAMFAGMMFGAIGWGTCSDILGRSAAFNATLCFTAFFGLLASFANSFTSLCIILFFLGSAVGGSMPTDGTLLLEHMPKSKQYLVTALSVFFSIGAVLSAVVALIVIPHNSCLPKQPCDVNIENQGWRHLLVALGLVTLSMFIARILFFRIHESPRYLVHAGRHLEAIESLQMISRFNGSDLTLELEDVQDQPHSVPPQAPETLAVPAPRPSYKINESRPRSTSTTIFSATDVNGNHTPSSSSPPNAPRSALVTQYNSTDAAPPMLDGYSFTTPAEAHIPVFPGSTASLEHSQNDGNTSSKSPSPMVSPTLPQTTSRPPRCGVSPRNHSTRVSSVYEGRLCDFLPQLVRKPLWAWWNRVMMVLSPEWLRTTLLVWAAWWALSLAFTMFNVFLPKLLETTPGSDTIDVTDTKSLDESLWDVVIFTIGGCPGAILGAWLIESPLGRKWSLAGSTFITAFFCAVFVGVESSWVVRASTVGISLSATTMWAVLYGWTPEIFGTRVRGTACGIASALSRIGGMIAPMLGGRLLMIDRSIPVYISVIIFIFAGFCILLIDETQNDGNAKVERIVVH